MTKAVTQETARVVAKAVRQEARRKHVGDMIDKTTSDMFSSSIAKRGIDIATAKFSLFSLHDRASLRSGLTSGPFSILASN